MSYFHEDLLKLLNVYGYWIVFFFVSVESIGIPFPGETILITASVYAGVTHNLNILFIIMASSFGAVLGDNLGYGIGRKGGYFLLRKFGKYIRINDAKIKLGQFLFKKYGGEIVFFGRFVAILRTLAAFLAGTNKMPWKKFIIFNALGGILWSTIYGLGGYFIGRNIVKIEGPFKNISIIASVLIFIFFVFFIRKYEKRLEDLAELEIPGPLKD